VSELPSALPECPPGYTWLIIPGSDSAVADNAFIEQDVDDEGSACSIFVPPLADEDDPEIMEYGQVQMEEVSAGAAWEKCSGGCGTELKAGGWGVCNACYRNGVPGRAYECEPGFVLCSGCGVHVKASVGICRPCGQKKNTVPEYVQSPALDKRNKRWARRAVGVQQLVTHFQLETGGRRASGAWVYYPDGYEANPNEFNGKQVEGAFLVDSFSQFHANARQWDYYMGRMLLHVYKETGLVFMAVCAGGSALTSPSGGGLRYSELLAELPSGLDLVLPVICGNDFYKSGRIVEFDTAWVDAVTELCQLVNDKGSRCFAVIGGSAETWQYNRKMSVEQCSRYDAHVERTRKGFEVCGAAAITGAKELCGLKLGDSIGCQPRERTCCFRCMCNVDSSGSVVARPGSCKRRRCSGGGS
jgi:hypothetical protein